MNDAGSIMALLALALAGGLPGKARHSADPEPVTLPRGAPRPKGFRWANRHQGTRERLRRMYQSHRRVQKLTDDASVIARDAVREAVAGEPDPTYGELHLTHAALVAADENRTSWAEEMLILLAKFYVPEMQEPEEADAATA